MSVKAKSPKFENDIQKVFEKYAESAFEKTFDIRTNEGVSLNDAKSKVAQVFADEFKVAGKELGKLITDHILSAKIKYVLAAPNGAVTGSIKIT